MYTYLNIVRLLFSKNLNSHSIIYLYTYTNCNGHNALPVDLSTYIGLQWSILMNISNYSTIVIYIFTLTDISN